MICYRRGSVSILPQRLCLVAVSLTSVWWPMLHRKAWPSTQQGYFLCSLRPDAEPRYRRGILILTVSTFCGTCVAQIQHRV